jgi:uncharacterized protein GlcG (DUF336 family)
MTLTLAEAMAAVDAAMAKAHELGITICVAVCGPDAKLTAFVRMDNTETIMVIASQGKAIGSVVTGRPSSDLGEYLTIPLPAGVSESDRKRIVPYPGAVPLIRAGGLVGACGVSGGTQEQDAECAEAAAAVVGD